MEGYSEYTKSALEILRRPELTMHWYAVPLLLITMYIVTKQLQIHPLAGRDRVPRRSILD